LQDRWQSTRRSIDADLAHAILGDPAAGLPAAGSGI
jgi:hypothetical protein